MSDLHDPSYRLPQEAGDLWETNARWWQETFTEGADPEYEEQIIPLLCDCLSASLAAGGGGRVLDVGCGEGQLSRAAARLECVSEVIGLDPTWSQLKVAASRLSPLGAGGPRRAPAGRVGIVRAAAGALPFPDSYFEAAFACLVFEHIEDLDQGISEVGRVLRTGGTFLLFLNHPLLQAPGSGWVDDHILHEQYWRIGPYLAEHHAVEEVAKNVWIPFIHRPLSRYVNALWAAGLCVTAMAEPSPPEGFLRGASEYALAAAFPRLMMLRATKSRNLKG